MHTLHYVLIQGSVCTLYDEGKLIENGQKLLENWKTPGICLVKMSSHRIGMALVALTFDSHLLTVKNKVNQFFLPLLYGI